MTENGGVILAKQSKLQIIPLGGLGEIGKNMTVIRYDDEMILIDALLSLLHLGIDMAKFWVTRGKREKAKVFRPNEHMNVSRHDHTFYNLNCVSDIFFCNPSIRFRDNVDIVPYDFALLKTHRILFARFREGMRSANAFKNLLS